MDRDMAMTAVRDVMVQYKSRLGIIGRIRFKLSMWLGMLTWLVFPADFDDLLEDMMSEVGGTMAGSMLGGLGDVADQAGGFADSEGVNMNTDADPSGVDLHSTDTTHPDIDLDGAEPFEIHEDEDEDGE